MAVGRAAVNHRHGFCADLPYITYADLLFSFSNEGVFQSRID